MLVLWVWVLLVWSVPDWSELRPASSVAHSLESTYRMAGAMVMVDTAVVTADTTAAATDTDMVVTGMYLRTMSC